MAYLSISSYCRREAADFKLCIFLQIFVFKLWKFYYQPFAGLEPHWVKADFILWTNLLQPGKLFKMLKNGENYSKDQQKPPKNRFEVNFLFKKKYSRLVSPHGVTGFVTGSLWKKLTDGKSFCSSENQSESFIFWQVASPPLYRHDHHCIVQRWKHKKMMIYHSNWQSAG